MSEFDSKALASAREVMSLIKQEHIGGDAQLLAKIQCLFIEAMEYAAPQSFGNSCQLLTKPKLSKEEIREVFLRNGFTIKEGHNDLKDYVYMAAYDLLTVAAAPKQESE